MNRIAKIIILIVLSVSGINATVIDVRFQTDYNDRLIVLKDNPPSAFKNYGDTIFNEFIDKEMVLEFEINEPQILTLYFPSTNMTEEILVIPNDKLKIEIQEINHQFRAVELSRKIDVSTVESIKKRDDILASYKEKSGEDEIKNQDEFFTEYSIFDKRTFNFIDDYTRYYDNTISFDEFKYIDGLIDVTLLGSTSKRIELIINRIGNNEFKEDLLLFYLPHINNMFNFSEAKKYYDIIRPLILTPNGMKSFKDCFRSLKINNGLETIDLQIVDTSMKDSEYKIILVTYYNRSHSSDSLESIEMEKTLNRDIDFIVESIELVQNIENLDIQLFVIDNGKDELSDLVKLYKTEDIITLKGVFNNSIGEQLKYLNLPAIYLLERNRISKKGRFASTYSLPQYLKENFKIKE